MQQPNPLAVTVGTFEKPMKVKRQNTPLIIGPNEGRTYSMGPMSAVFKADLEETDSSVSVSEWWIEPNTEGPHAHSHPESHVYYVIEGALSVFLEHRGWQDAGKGSFIYIPGGIEHSFENRGKSKVGFISFNTPGGFESSLPNIVGYFNENPLGAAKNDT